MSNAHEPYRILVERQTFRLVQPTDESPALDIQHSYDGHWLYAMCWPDGLGERTYVERLRVAVSEAANLCGELMGEAKP